MLLALLLRHRSQISLLRRQCPWGYLGLGSIHALALAACPWRRALALAAAFLGLGCVPMGLPWPWQHACLGFGCVPMVMCLRLGCCMPWSWLRAHGAALSIAACIPWIHDGWATWAAIKYNSHRTAGRILCRRLKYLTGYCTWWPKL